VSIVGGPPAGPAAGPAGFVGGFAAGADGGFGVGVTEATPGGGGDCARFVAAPPFATFATCGGLPDADAEANADADADADAGPDVEATGVVSCAGGLALGGPFGSLADGDTTSEVAAGAWPRPNFA
jgi:hypothetical protein